MIGEAFLATDTAFGQLARLGARHRAHARVEDPIRCASTWPWAHDLTSAFARLAALPTPTG